MVYHGTFQNGVVILDEKVELANGQRVRVDVEREAEETSTVWQELLKLSGSIKGGPSDVSVNHNHYLYGAPKEEPEA